MGLALERDYRRQIVLSEIDSSFLVLHDKNSGYAWDPLPWHEAARLATHVEVRGRYALLQSMDKAQRISFFEGRDIFDAMGEIEFGPGYRERLSPEISALPSMEARLLLFLASYINSLGYALPLALVHSTGLDASDLSRGPLSRKLGGLLTFQDGYVFAKYRALSLTASQEHLANDELFDLLTRFVRQLSPYVTRDTRRRKTFESRLVKAVMRARGLRSVLSRHSLPAFFEQLAPEYGQDARYWEQRSIASQITNDLAAANSYAARAVDLAPRDSWRRATLGRLFLVRSYRDAVVGGPESWDMYGRGKAELEKALELSPRNAVALLILFHHTVELYRQLLLDSGLNDDYDALREDVEEAYSLCKYHPSLSHSQEQVVIRDIYGMFLGLLLVQSGASDGEEAQAVLHKKVPPISAEQELM